MDFSQRRLHEECAKTLARYARGRDLWESHTTVEGMAVFMGIQLQFDFLYA